MQTFKFFNNIIEERDVQSAREIYYEGLVIYLLRGSRQNGTDIYDECAYFNEENENKYDPIEEHNLLYVGITRAKQILHITYHYELNDTLKEALENGSSNISHTFPTNPIKPIIFPKNNYLSKGVTEVIKRMTEEDYINIKKKYKITCTKNKVHRSLYEITGKNSLKIMEELSTITSNLPILLGNYIDHYIGYIINKNKTSYHPDLQHIKLIDYIGYNYNIYNFDVI